MNPIYDFERKTPSKLDIEIVHLKCGTYLKVYTINSVHDLIQYIGFGKYINSNAYSVFVRGQSDLFKNSEGDVVMVPSLLRGRTNKASILSKFYTKMNALKDDVDLFSNYDRIVLESMLQHYGIKTPYLDLVDNIWVALWFALHKSHCTVADGHEYINYSNNDGEYSYIFLMASDALTPSTTQTGVFHGEDSILIDLRKAVPSYFLRPHAQHAYMIRKKREENEDCSDMIVGIARISTSLGLEWLGNNKFLSVSSLFPSPVYDSGLQKILDSYPRLSKSDINQYGSIQIMLE